MRDAHRENATRTVEVLASRQEIEQFVREGYLVRTRLIPGHEIDRLRSALEEVAAADDQPEIGGGRAFGGIFLRHLMDKHPVFLELLNFAPAVSVARAVFGPAVQSRGLTGRICPRDSSNLETEWHFHQRVIPDPLPPMLSRPQTLDVLLYLDDIDLNSGPLCIVPGSHLWLEEDLPRDRYDALPGQIEITVPAGSAVFAHGSLWHRARPTQPGCGERRLLLFGYGPAWQKASVYGRKPVNGLTSSLLESGDDETLELLGMAGYM
ncbi:MAG TPA: phytanoyl-CoA dioxygenase family protein [Chthonomonadales bacterium]|nr:phytanoyl-CoA dioxygenase family protein [Chthonomonadales bacterium]